MAAAAVQHLQRIVESKAPLLAKGRDPTDVSCLAGFVSFLFEQIGARETQYRRKCMQLFVALAKHGGAKGGGDRPDEEYVLRFCAEGGVDGVVAIAEPTAVAAMPPPLSETGEDGLAEVRRMMTLVMVLL